MTNLFSLTKPNFTVLHHKSCNDGLAAAAIFLDSIEHDAEGEVKVFPISHNENFDFSCITKEVNSLVILDFVLLPFHVEALKKRADEIGLPYGDINIVYVDHHQGNEANIQQQINANEFTIFPFFDLNESGASLTAEFDWNTLLEDLKPEDANGFYINDMEFLPSGMHLSYYYNHNHDAYPHTFAKVVELIKVRDLWLTDVPNRKEQADMFALGLRAGKYLDNYQVNADTLQSILDDFDKIYKVGEAIYQSNMDMVGVLLKQVYVVTASNGAKAGFAFASPVLSSELGNRICKMLENDTDQRVGIVLSIQNDRSSKGQGFGLSLRGDGTVNCIDIAKALQPTGGGHPNAAGCWVSSMNVEEVGEMVKKVLEEM